MYDYDEHVINEFILKNTSFSPSPFNTHVVEMNNNAIIVMTKCLTDPNTAKSVERKMYVFKVFFPFINLDFLCVFMCFCYYSWQFIC